jgi:hypothetical protein
MDACQVYKSGSLLNPDTCRLYRDDIEGCSFISHHVIPYTFKHFHGLGPRALEELADKIISKRMVAGAQKDTTKVYLGTKLKILMDVTAMQWCTKKH